MKRTNQIIGIALVLIVLSAATVFIIKGTLKTTGQTIIDSENDENPENLQIETAIDNAFNENSYILNNINTCVSEWQCDSWSRCRNREQTRTCVDLNGCLVPNNLPETERRCSSGGGGGSILPILEGGY